MPTESTGFSLKVADFKAMEDGDVVVEDRGFCDSVKESKEQVAVHLAKVASSMRPGDLHIDEKGRAVIRNRELSSLVTSNPSPGTRGWFSNLGCRCSIKIDIAIGEK